MSAPPPVIQSSATGSPNRGLNLLRFRPIVTLVKWAAFPVAFQVLVLAVFIALVAVGCGHQAPAGINAKLYAKANLVTLAIWGLWWPSIIWVTFLSGRVWCVVCPLELVSSQAAKLARKLGLRPRSLTGWLAKGGLVVLIFVFVQLLVPGVQIHRVPHYTSLFLWASLVLAVVVGLFFKDRAFCRGFCPVALLLNAYGRGGMLAVRPSLRNCRHSAGHSPNARACPSLLNPSRLESNNDCLGCCECLKADTAGTMELLLRVPYSQADTRESLASWPLTLFVMVVSGFVTYELSGVWKAAEAVFLQAPALATTTLDAATASGWIQGLWTIFVVPLLLWLVLGALTLMAGGAKSLGEAWRRLALPLAVVIATGHMAKGLEKFTSWVGFLPGAWAEPDGVQTVLKMHTKSLPQPAAWFGLPSLSIAAMTLLVAGIALALREARLADPGKAHTRMAPILLLGGFYFFLVCGWGGWLM
jgi:hypothetical protein